MFCEVPVEKSLLQEVVAVCWGSWPQQFVFHHSGGGSIPVVPYSAVAGLGKSFSESHPDSSH